MNQFFSQIELFVSKLKGQHNFYISLYENDSQDSTSSLIHSYDYKNFIDFSVISENKNLPKFGSVAKEERVKNLAIARNIAVTAKDFYKNVDYILAIDSDIRYDENFVGTLLNWESFGIKDPDIFSGVSLRDITKFEKLYGGLSLKENLYLMYDTWSTRRNNLEQWGDFKEDYKQNPISKFYCTFNGVCAIKAKPFQEGARYHHFNKRLNTFDLEHAVLVEWFHENGYNNIYINQSLLCYHDQ